MIRIWLDEGEVKDCVINGDLADIGADTCEAINIIYNIICDKDENAGKFFKDNMIREANSDLLWERNTYKEDESSDTYNEAVKMMKDIIDNKGENNNG